MYFRAGSPEVEQIRAKYGIGELATLAQIEPIALELLDDWFTQLDGAALVMNRVLDPKEDLVHKIFFADPEEAYKILLTAKEKEVQASN